MNYRHAFHAGGFADVIKHVVLVRILTYLQDKPASFRVIDTHAGAGLYDLTGDEARRGGEWLTGIARADAGALLGRHRAAHKTLSRHRPSLQSAGRSRGLSRLAADRAGAIAAAGSPDRMRGRTESAQAPDRCTAPRHPGARRRPLDGWVALPAFVPPKERRGLVVIDPPYEQKDEFERLAEGFAQAFAKWPTGIYLLWYPVKSRRACDGLARHVAGVVGAGATSGKCLRLEFSVAPQAAEPGLTSAGVLIANPPWTLAAELRAILPELEKPLGRGGAGRFRLETPKA